jgi:hypothetical protein
VSRGTLADVGDVLDVVSVASVAVVGAPLPDEHAASATQHTTPTDHAYRTARRSDTTEMLRVPRISDRDAPPAKAAACRAEPETRIEALIAVDRGPSGR